MEYFLILVLSVRFLCASLLRLKFHLYVQFHRVCVILVRHNGNKIPPFLMELFEVGV